VTGRKPADTSSNFTQYLVGRPLHMPRNTEGRRSGDAGCDVTEFFSHQIGVAHNLMYCLYGPSHVLFTLQY